MMFDALTVTEFARRCGVSRAAVHQWIQQTPGLTLQRLGGLTLLTPEDQQRILSRPRKKMGRPKKVVDSASTSAS